MAPFSAEVPNSPFWADAEPIDDVTVWSPAIGYMHTGALPWIYTADHGWQLFAGDHGGTGLLWDPDLGWLFTSPEVYPFIGRIIEANSFEWLRYIPGTRNPRMFDKLSADR